MPTSPSDSAGLALPVDLDGELARARVRGALFGDAPPPVTVDRFTILARIGSGGMSTVYAAYDPRLDRRIALKLLLAGDHDSTQASQARQARLLREARAMARLSHPNVAAVHDVGLVDPEGDAPQVWIAMEFIDGEPLGAWRSRAKPGVTEILDVYAQAGRGLAAAHAAGLIHRDFKPDNAMRDAGGRVRVLDFGLARATEDPDADQQNPTANDDHVSRLASGGVTTTGALVGTPAYMAPELFAGRPADAASDQFGFCAALYEAIWGERPFAGTSVAAIVAAFERGTSPNPPRRRDVPASVRAAILRGLDREPSARWPSIDALLSELAGARGRTTRVVGIALATATLASVVAIASTRTQPCAEADRPVDGLWDDATRASVDAALVGVDRPYASDVSARVRERLDAYEQALRAAYRSSCVATHETRMQTQDLLDREAACLDRRGLGLRALVGVLLDADVPVLDRAVQAAAGLRPIDACLDRETLLAATAPPQDDATAAATGEIDELVERAFASNMAGRYEEARGHAETALARAEALGDARLLAEAHDSLGWALEQLGEDDLAYSHLADAHYLADATRQDVRAAESASRLLSCIDIAASERDELELWRRNAQAAIDRIPDPEPYQATLDAAMAFALQQRGELAAARALYERALEVRKRRSPGPTAMITGLQTQLAGVLAMLGESEQAKALVDEATEIARADLGANHPHRGQMLINAAGVHAQAGDFTGGERIAREALAVLEPSVGHDHPHIATIYSNIGAALCMQERWPECAEALEEAIAIFERLDKRTLQWVNALDNYAMVLDDLGRHDEAIARSRVAHGWYETKMGADSPQTGNHHVLLGNALAKAGHTDEAATHYRRALEIAAKRGDTKLEERARAAVTALR